MNEPEPTTTWEIDVTLTVELERDGLDKDPSTFESMALDRAVKEIVEGAEPDEIDGWRVEAWTVRS
jgi:hypothetical protein